MDELKKLVFQKINFSKLKMGKSDFALLVEYAASKGIDEAQVKKLVFSSLKSLKKFKETTLPLALLEDRNFTFEAEGLFVPPEVLKNWQEEIEAKLKELQNILAMNNQDGLREFLVENPGMELAAKVPLPQFVKLLNKDVKTPIQEPVPEPEIPSNNSSLETAPQSVSEVATPEAASLSIPTKPETKNSEKKPSKLPVPPAVLAIAAVVIVIIICFAMSGGIEYGSYVDSRDGHTYKTITLGTQEWMAENAAYATKKSACYENSNANCDKYGRLYTWYDAQNACPDSFHLPSLSEYKTLISYVNSIDDDRLGAGTLLKEKGPKEKETLGFVSIMTGNRSAKGEFHNVGDYTRYWTTNRPEPGFSNVVKLDRDSSDVRIGKFVRETFFSVRCLKNYEGWVNNSKADYDEVYDAFYYPKNFDMVKTVRIGTKVWTAQNVSDKTMSTGVYSMDKKGKPRKECGMFYTHDDAGKVCPPGWRLASKDDFTQLAYEYGIKSSNSYNGRSDDLTLAVFDNLAPILYSETGLNLKNCGTVVVQNSPDMKNPEKCVKGYCSQQFDTYAGFWGENFNAGVSKNNIVLDEVDAEYGYDGLLPVRCVYDGTP